MKKRKTLKDVAAAAGVSKMTASRALRGEKDVSRANVDKVRQAARDIGYYGNHLAASLSSARSDLIGVVVPSLSNIVFPQVMSGVTDALAGTGFQPVFGVTDYDTGKENEILRSMLSWRPAGLIVTGLDQPDDTRMLLADAGIPIVQIMDCDGDPVDACVGFSHTKAGHDIAEALIAEGRTRFGYAGCNMHKDTRAAKRKKGFLEALKAHGIELKAMVTDVALSSVVIGRDLTAQLLASHPELDCIYYSNDDLAAGGLFHCIDAGISVPERVVLAGFNGLDIIEGFPGKIATSRTSRREIGEAAAKMILDSLKNDKIESGRNVVVQPTISLGLLSKGGQAVG
ncbi:LacI family DNA-binding transcriptional regulator [Puniceibacterium sediminis]|uniref:Transcriptional regulator, LacI family n=1 Tax=Puniceibacterium sediminis TaxID=1608407 RepID=A0A238W5L7_9RHOB|nr:LacI family DNA-binding transcriptional regulator [Puniceibacterium sediminis]SNR41788.1 transcriptional regulator, LacI family [Puniceibacterium sediminis]